MTYTPPEIRSIQRAVTYIQTELREDRIPSLEDVAKAAGVSKFHFHRVFKLITGETCAQIITRLRLAKATAELKQANTSITQAAFAAGYGSGQAFAKAIRRELSTSASEIRSDPERLSETIKTLIKPDLSNSDHTPPFVQIEIASLDPLDVLVIRSEDVYPDLIDTYNGLFEMAGGPQNVRAVLGLPHRDIETSLDGGFIFDAALVPLSAVTVTPDTVVAKRLDGGLYLLAQHKGLDADIPVTLDALYSHILMCPDIDLTDAPCVHHYIDDPEEVAETNCRTDIYIPIAAA
ncbi:MAG: helix-turn-helix domain-containing protein [Litorimonas sp.]